MPKRNNGPWLPEAVRFMLVFSIAGLLGFTVEFIPWVAQNIITPFIVGLTWVAGAAIHTFGGLADINQTEIRHPINQFAIQIAYGCSGVEVSLLLCAGMIAFPARWVERGVGWLAGTLTIMSINIVRVISLYYIGQYSRQWFDWAHMYAWDVLIIIDGVIVFLLWIRWLPPLKHRHDALA